MFTSAGEPDCCPSGSKCARAFEQVVAAVKSEGHELKELSRETKEYLRIQFDAMFEALGRIDLRSEARVKEAMNDVAQAEEQKRKDLEYAIKSNSQGIFYTTRMLEEIIRANPEWGINLKALSVLAPPADRQGKEDSTKINVKSRRSEESDAGEKKCCKCGGDFTAGSPAPENPELSTRVESQRTDEE